MKNQNEAPEIRLESDLSELLKLIMIGWRTGKIKKDVALSRVVVMIGYLSNDKHLYVPKKINTIGELYTFSEDEILHKFRNYKIKTWLKLNEILERYGLPNLNLPQEYKSDPLNS